MNVKDILKAFWQYSEDYEGDISCRQLTAEETTEQGLKAEKGLTYYRVETDGNTFTAAAYGGDENRVFFKVEGDNSPSAWKSTSGVPTIQIDGAPHEAPIYGGESAADIAEKVGVSAVTIYSYAHELGRLPTVEEALEMKERKKAGRPRKY